jgi:uncharacterized protein
MTDSDKLPQQVTRLALEETFTFACHPGVPCFTECCRMLVLTLSPYDVLRLRQGTGLSSSQLLADYLIVEQEPGEPFPRVYLSMVDDGRASCVFVSPAGCRVYPHRPAACRTYPLGRAVVRGPENTQLTEHYVLLQESHCQGFAPGARTNTIPGYTLDQGLAPYNRCNDRFAQILQHQAIRLGFLPSAGQSRIFLDTLYDLDRYRRTCLARPELPP